MKFRIVCLFIPFFIFAYPQQPEVISGNVTFSQHGSVCQKVRTNEPSIVHWDSFSIASGEQVFFCTSSSVLNRVTGDQPSNLLGKIQSPGSVYLINPNGIVIGQNGVIDVANFVGTTFDISNEAFLAGGDLNFSGDSTSSLKNEGSIQANGGNILLFAHHVVNKGSLTAKDGDVQLGAGHDLLLAIEGKEYLLVKPNLAGKGIHNGGKIEALRAVLACHSNPYELGIQNSGVIEANTVEEVNGEIYIVAKDSCFVNRTTMKAPRGKIQCEIENGKSINFELIEALGGEIVIHSTPESQENSDRWVQESSAP